MGNRAGSKSRRFAVTRHIRSSDPRILTRKCCDRFRSVGAYWVVSQRALCSPFSPPLLHQFRSVSSVRSCDRFYHGKKFLTAPTGTHTRSQIVGDNEALPPDRSQKFRPSPLEALIFWIPSQKALTPFV